MSASLELLHIQTNRVFALLANRSIFIIGKPDGEKPIDIDVSVLPNSDIVSRNHAQIWINNDEYHITDMGSSNGTFVNGVKLQPKIFWTLNSGDTISLGQGDKITFMFRVKQQNAATPQATNSTNNTAPTKITSAATTEAEIPITLITKLLGLVMMIGGLCFLAANIAIGGFLNAPLIIPSIIGILILIYGGQIRIFGWVLIAVGVALAIATGTIILAPISLLTFLITASCCSAGYQLFTDGKILDFNPLALKAVMRGRR
ncbi:FHA domain-containing protein [Tolypothrix sp. VBCCA 56010]|uniref:FHA domain-containing protein n=1 Tax=Tolypothrix sp. VBCCA 56010 TaxID=3137731 RepID=UPI003D7CD74C